MFSSYSFVYIKDSQYICRHINRNLLASSDMKLILTLLSICLTSLFFRGTNPFLREDKAVFIREKHSIHIVDTNRNYSIAECQRSIPMTKDGKEYKELQKKMLNQFIENENNIILRDLCSEFSQDFVIFNIAYDNSGSFVSASLVFPNKDEMDSTIISDIFLNKVYITLKECSLDSWMGISPFVILAIPIRVK